MQHISYCAPRPLPAAARFCLFMLVCALSTPVLQAQCDVEISAGEDKYTCFPVDPVTLDGSINELYLSVQWTPPIGLIGANTLTPTATPQQTTTYVVTARVPNFDENLIENPGFGAGTAGFSSAYNYSPGNLWPEGTYDITDNPQASHPNFAPCQDHSGDGNMMVVNGAGIAGVEVYCQTVSVNPNTEYIFSAWVASVIPTAPAQLQFSINGTLLGSILNAPGGTCAWVNFYQIWNSGANGSANICIVNQNTALSGNDFAIDDLAFYEICKPRDTVTVHVVKINAQASPILTTIPCNGAPVTLSGNGSSTGPNITYEWTTGDGNIVSGATTLSPVVNAPGEYTLTVKYDDGNIQCTKTSTVTVTTSPVPPSAVITNPPPLGCATPQVTLVAALNVQPGPFSYNWETANGNILSGQSAAAAIVNAAGTYSVTVTQNATGCTGTGSVTVTSNGTPPTAVATGNIINCNSPQAALSGAGSSTGNPFTYAWTTTNGTLVGPTNGQNATATAPGTYLLTIVNPTNGCTATDTAIVTANLLYPAVTIRTPDTLDCLTDTLSLLAGVNTVNVNYLWTTVGGNIASGGGTATPNVTAPGSYSVVVTNTTNGCRDTATTTVLANLAPPTIAIAAADSITCQRPTVSLNASVGSAQNFTYAWTATNGGNIVGNPNTLTPTVNAAGIYTLNVVNTQTGCSTTAATQVFADQNAVVANANAPDVLTCTVGSVAINSSGSTTLPGITYSWSTVSPGGQLVGNTNSPTATVGAPGTYQLLVTNPANGCTATDLVTVSENKAAPVAQIAAPGLLTCTLGQITLDAAGSSAGSSNFSITWTASAGGHIVSGQNSLAPTVDSAGTYTLTISNLQNGCTASATVNVQKDAATPVAQIASALELTCARTQIQLSGAGSSTGANFSANWTTVGGQITANPTTLTPTVNAPGTYNLLITNTQNQCTATASVIVSENKTAPILNIAPPTTLTCADPTATLTATASGQAAITGFQWQTSGGQFVGGQTTAMPTVNAPGNYTVSVIDPANGCSATASVSVSENKTAPTLSIAPPAVITCANPVITLTAMATGQMQITDFQWQTSGTGNFLTGQTTATPTVNAPGIYATTIVDPANGCSATASVLVEQNAVFPAADAGTGPVLTCQNPLAALMATADAGPGITYLWTTTDGQIGGGSTTLTPTVSAPGTYFLAVTNQNTGCTGTDAVQVSENKTAPTAEAGPTDTLNCGLANLALAGTANSASGSFSIVWTTTNGQISSGANTLAPTIASPGTYLLQITDLANGCTATDAVEILKDENAPLASAGAPDTLTCDVLQTTLAGTASTGTGISYSWTTADGRIVSGQNSLAPTVDAPGTYLLTVVNALNGCTNTSAVVIAEDTAQPNVDAGLPNTLTCEKTSLNLMATALATGATFSVSWTTSDGHIVSGGNMLAPQIDAPGTYVLTVKNLKNGCQSTDFVEVSIDTLRPAVAASAPQILTCIQLSAPVNGTVSTPGNHIFEWAATSPGAHILSGQFTQNALVDEPGFYRLTVKNTANGCQSQTNVQVQENTTKPIAEAGQAALLTCKQTQTVLDGTGTQTGAGITYLWSSSVPGGILGGGTTLAPTIGAAATYTLTVTDAANGCTSTDQVTVTEDKVAPTVGIAAPQTLTCVQTTVVLGGSSNPNIGISASWQTPSGHFVSGQNTLAPTVDAPGTYILNIENQSNGCIGTATTVVPQNVQPPVAEAGPGGILHCQQSSLNLQGSSPTGNNMAFEWTTANGHFSSNPAAATPEIDAPGTYLLLVTNPANGCTDTDETLVEEIPDPDFAVEIEQPDCHFPVGNIEVSAVTGGLAPFSYSLGGAFQSEGLFENQKPGTYTVVVRDANGCLVEQTVAVSEPFQPEVQIAAVDVLEFGDSARLNPVTNLLPGQIAAWEWSPASSLSCADCEHPWAKPFGNQLFKVTVTDVDGCTGTANVLVLVKNDREVYAPNVFSPNDDGVNDGFTLFTKGVSRIRSLRVFDRWGNAVFARFDFPPNDERNGWQGDFRGKTVNPAVFVWYAELEFLDGSLRFYKGDVSVVSE
ncbi:MAG: PKD domain-containing protein [Saprospiraceae bacterium]